MGDFLREQIIGTEQVTDIEIAKRDIHVMTRLSEDIVEILDALVDLNVFKSRSEAVASYVESSIVSKQELYLKVLEQFKEVEDKRGKAMETVLDAFEKLGE
jgi:Arc/MetJ-type ribon-helix-helix transcriptional regulator